MKKFLFIISLVFFSFLITSRSYAISEVVFDTPYSNFSSSSFDLSTTSVTWISYPLGNADRSVSSSFLSYQYKTNSPNSSCINQSVRLYRNTAPTLRMDLYGELITYLPASASTSDGFGNYIYSGIVTLTSTEIVAGDPYFLVFIPGSCQILSATSSNTTYTSVDWPGTTLDLVNTSPGSVIGLNLVSASHTLSFSYPKQDVISRDFFTWEVSVNDLETDDLTSAYYLDVRYSVLSTSSVYVEKYRLNQDLSDDLLFIVNNQIYSSSSVSSFDVSVPKKNVLDVTYDLTVSSTWQVQAFLYKADLSTSTFNTSTAVYSGTSTLLALTPVTTFIFDYYAPTTTPVGASTSSYLRAMTPLAQRTLSTSSQVVGANIPSSTTDSNLDTYCGWAYSTSSWWSITDTIQQSYCLTVYYVFYPQTESSYSFLSETLASLKEKFPFNIIFKLKDYSDILHDRINSNQSDLSMTLSFLPNDPTVSLLSSSTLSNAIGESNKNLLFTLISALLWVGLGYVILETIT